MMDKALKIAEMLWAGATVAGVIWLYLALAWLKKTAPEFIEAQKTPSITCTEDLIRMDHANQREDAIKAERKK